METIIVKHSDLDKLNYLCEMLNITPRVIHADPDKGETEFYLGPRVDVKQVEWLLSLG